MVDRDGADGPWPPLVTAVRALRLDPDRLPAGPLRDLFDHTAPRLHDDRADRPLDADLEAAVALLAQGLGQ